MYLSAQLQVPIPKLLTSTPDQKQVLWEVIVSTGVIHITATVWLLLICGLSSKNIRDVQFVCGVLLVKVPARPSFAVSGAACCVLCAADLHRNNVRVFLQWHGRTSPLNTCAPFCGMLRFIPVWRFVHTRRILYGEITM